jgi:tRNA(Arg) A34 adenosine deaminase TadA
MNLVRFAVIVSTTPFWIVGWEVEKVSKASFKVGGVVGAVVVDPDKKVRVMLVERMFKTEQTAQHW